MRLRVSLALVATFNPQTSTRYPARHMNPTFSPKDPRFLGSLSMSSVSLRFENGRVFGL